LDGVLLGLRDFTLDGVGFQWGLFLLNLGLLLGQETVALLYTVVFLDYFEVACLFALKGVEGIGGFVLKRGTGFLLVKVLQFL
jgi:hypothetical protein